MNKLTKPEAYNHMFITSTDDERTERKPHILTGKIKHNSHTFRSRFGQVASLTNSIPLRQFLSLIPIQNCLPLIVFAPKTNQPTSKLFCTPPYHFAKIHYPPGFGAYMIHLHRKNTQHSLLRIHFIYAFFITKVNIELLLVLHFCNSYPPPT